MTDKYRPEIHVGRDSVVLITNDEAYKIPKDYDEDQIKLEVEYMNEARNNGIPVPEVIEITSEGMIMEKAKGKQLYGLWDKFDIDKKKTFVLSYINTVKKLPKKGNLHLVHTDLDLQNIFVDDDGEITSIIDWQDCKYLPEVYTRATPIFLREGNIRTTKSDTEVLEAIFSKEMGKLSEIEVKTLNFRELAEEVPYTTKSLRDASLNLTLVKEIAKDFYNVL